jgi:hypothetical protein
MRKDKERAAELDRIEELETTVNSRIRKAESRRVSFWNNYSEGRGQLNALKTTQVETRNRLDEK